MLPSRLLAEDKGMLTQLVPGSGFPWACSWLEIKCIPPSGASLCTAVYMVTSSEVHTAITAASNSGEPCWQAAKLH